MDENLPQEGDIIMSDAFPYGYRERGTSGPVTIDGRTRERPVSVCISNDDRLAHAAATGEIPDKFVTEDWGAYDESRASARWLVTGAICSGGGTGHGPGDYYPNGWHILAQRLDDDGSYNPDAEEIHFYLTGCFTCQLKPEQVRIVGKMEKTWVPS